MTTDKIEHPAYDRIHRLAERGSALVEDACHEGKGWQLWLNHVAEAAEIAAASAYLVHLAECSEANFWALPEDVQAEVALLGCDFGDSARDALAATMDVGPDVLSGIWQYAAQRYQAHIDRLLAGGTPGGRA